MMFGSSFSFGSRQFASGAKGVIFTAIAVLLNGELVTSRLSASEQLSLSEVLNGRMTATLSFLAERPSTWRPAVGSSIFIFVGSVRRFGGTVDQVREIALAEREGSWNAMEVDCLDFNLVPQRFFVTSATYSGQTAGVIVRNLITTYLVNDGIMIDGVTDGPTLTTYDIKDRTLSQVFDDLSDITGMIWSIGPFRVMEFRANELSTAPFSVTDANSTGRHVATRQSRDQYRNVQIIRGNAVLVTRTDAAEITARKAVEGGSGRYERFEADDSILTTAQANAKGDGLLTRYGQIDQEVSFETDKDGLRPGQRITVTFPDLNVSGTYLVTAVDWHVLVVSPQVNRYRVTVNSGEVRTPWLVFWKKLMQATPERGNF